MWKHLDTAGTGELPGPLCEFATLLDSSSWGYDQMTPTWRMGSQDGRSRGSHNNG